MSPPARRTKSRRFHGVTRYISSMDDFAFEANILYLLGLRHMNIRGGKYCDYISGFKFRDSATGCD